MSNLLDIEEPNLNEWRPPAGKYVKTETTEYVCPTCGRAVFRKQVFRNGKPNKPFLCCSGFPACDWTDYRTLKYN